MHALQCYGRANRHARLLCSRVHVSSFEGLMGDPPARAILVILVRGKIGVGPIGGLPKGTRPVFVSSEAVGYRQAGYFDRTVRIGPKTDLKLHRPTHSLSLSLYGNVIPGIQRPQRDSFSLLRDTVSSVLCCSTFMLFYFHLYNNINKICLKHRIDRVR